MGKQGGTCSAYHASMQRLSAVTLQRHLHLQPVTKERVRRSRMEAGECGWFTGGGMRGHAVPFGCASKAAKPSAPSLPRAPAQPAGVRTEALPSSPCRLHRAAGMIKAQRRAHLEVRNVAGRLQQQVDVPAQPTPIHLSGNRLIDTVAVPAARASLSCTCECPTATTCLDPPGSCRRSTSAPALGTRAGTRRQGGGSAAAGSSASSGQRVTPAVPSRHASW